MVRSFALAAAVLCRLLGSAASASSLCDASGFEQDVDYHDGQGLGHANATGATDCCSQCNSEAWAALGCSHFTLAPDGTCWFKKDDNGRRASKGSISGGCAPTPAPAPTPPTPAPFVPPACPDASGARLNVACVGDSITAGAHAGGRPHAYPEQLQAMLDAPGAPTAGRYCVWNGGESGSTAQRAPHGDSPYWQRGSFATLTAFARGWDVIVLMLGTNDAKDACDEVGNCGGTCRNTTCCNWPHAGQDTAKQSNLTWAQDCSDLSCPFATDYTALVGVLRGLGTAAGTPPDLYLAVPPPLMSSSATSKPYGMNQTIINELLPALIPRINAAARLPHAPIDVFGAMGGTSGLACGTGAAASLKNLCNHTCVASPHDPQCALQCDAQSCDACHPNADGYAVLARTILDAVF